MSKTEWMGYDDQGDPGMPGTEYREKIAAVKLCRGGYELYVRSAYGSHQGYQEEHSRIERRYRAATLDDLLRVGIAEIRRDSDFQPSHRFEAAVRNAIFEAQDAAVGEAAV